MNLVIIVPLVVISWAILMTLLERIRPYLPGYRIVREEFWTDLIFYMLLQSYLLALVIAGIIRWIDGQTHLTRLHLVTSWPIWLQLLFFLITHDLWQYWFHRLEHRNRWMWRIHEAAHAPLHVDWLAGARSHALEILIAQTMEFAPIILLGADASVPLVKGMIDSLWGMYNHSNIDVRTGRLLYLFNGPELHRWHHDLGAPAPGANFATKLAVWDWIWGTAYYPRDRKAQYYGLRRSDAFPHGSYWRQLMYAFRPARREVERRGSSMSTRG